jgi:pimeloyl-ACP methyl ester carboxylesterase
VLLVPDPPNVLEHHAPLVESLSKDVRVIAVELPGFGFSRPASGFHFTLEENATCIERVLTILDVERAVLVMPCLSGLVAMELARRAPDRVAGVVTVQTPCLRDALTWSQRVDFRGLVGTPIAGQLFVRVARRKLAESWYRAALPRGASIHGWLDTALTAYDEGADYCLASALQALRRHPIDEGPIDAPLLSIWGGRDRTHKPTDAAALLARSPRSKLVLFDGCGHFPDLEAPERFAAELRTFLREETV